MIKIGGTIRKDLPANFKIKLKGTDQDYKLFDFLIENEYKNANRCKSTIRNGTLKACEFLSVVSLDRNISIATRKGTFENLNVPEYLFIEHENTIRQKKNVKYLFD